MCEIIFRIMKRSSGFFLKNYPQPSLLFFYIVGNADKALNCMEINTRKNIERYMLYILYKT